MKHKSTQCGQKMRTHLVTGQVILADSLPLSSLDEIKYSLIEEGCQSGLQDQVALTWLPSSGETLK